MENILKKTETINETMKITKLIFISLKSAPVQGVRAP